MSETCAWLVKVSATAAYPAPTHDHKVVPDSRLFEQIICPHEPVVSWFQVCKYETCLSLFKDPDEDLLVETYWQFKLI